MFSGFWNWRDVGPECVFGGRCEGRKWQNLKTRLNWRWQVVERNWHAYLQHLALVESQRTHSAVSSLTTLLIFIFSTNNSKFRTSQPFFVLSLCFADGIILKSEVNTTKTWTVWLLLRKHWLHGLSGLIQIFILQKLWFSFKEFPHHITSKAVIQSKVSIL